MPSESHAGLRAALATLLATLAGCSGPAAHDDAATPDTADAAPDDARQCSSSTAAPPARGDAVGTVDPETGQLWIVGGDVGPTVMCRTQPVFQNDVWRYDPDCDRWTQVMTEGGPSARARAASALDTRRRRLLVFGGRYRAGETGPYTVYNDVWALDLATAQWSQVTTSGAAPSGRANASAVYDATADELVIYGGNTSRDGLRYTPQGDVWALNLGTGAWRRVATSGMAPRPRLFHAAAIRERQMLVFGGGGADALTGSFYNEAFALDLATGTWSAVQLSGDDPLGRINHVLIADPTMPRYLLIAGHDDDALGNRNDVLALDPGGAVRTLTVGDTFNRMGSGFCDFPPDFANVDTSAPERRSAFVAGVDPRRNRVLVFGGKTDCGTTRDVWAVDLATGAWRPLRTSNEGVACQRSGRTGCTSLCQ
jgi:hypothetical protein